MALSVRAEQQLMRQAKQDLGKAKDVLESLRAQCLARGSTGIIGLGRVFRIMDDNGNKTLDKDEFSKGLRDYGVQVTPDQVDELFQQIDKDGSGSIDYEEFLRAVRVCFSFSSSCFFIYLP